MVTSDISNEVDRLFYLKRLLESGRFDEAFRFFSMYSNLEHSGRFSEFLRYKLRTDVVEDYLVIRTNVNGTIFTCVVGFDDNNRFFCHVLPVNILPLDSAIEPKTLRRLMGFDYHVWEINYRVSLEGRVRLQGDIIVDVLRIFGSHEELASYLVLELIKRIIGLVGSNPREYMVFFEPLRRGFYELFLGFEDRYDYLRSVLIMIFSGGLSSEFSSKIITLDDTLEYPSEHYPSDQSVLLKMRYLLDNLVSFAESLPELERKLEFVLGRHRIRLLGISGEALSQHMNRTLSDIASFVFGKSLESPFSFDSNFFIALREHELVALHPEHKSIALSLSPGLYRLDSLNSIFARIQRILRIKMLLVGPPKLKQQYVARYTQRGFNNSYSHVIGANFYVMRDVLIALPFGSISIEYLIWTFDSEREDQNIQHLYYRGSRGLILLVDSSSDRFIRKIVSLINNFWKMAGRKWPVLIIADEDCQKNRTGTIKKLIDIVNHIKQYNEFIYFVCTPLNNEDVVLSSLRNTVRDLLRRLNKR